MVPADKVARIKGIQKVQQKQATSQELAGIAGMLMSAAPAPHMAPLYLRSLYNAIQPEAGWDTLVTQLDLTEEDLQYWFENLDTCNGKTWLRRDNPIHVCGHHDAHHDHRDASRMGYAAFAPHGEIKYDMVMSFD